MKRVVFAVILMGSLCPEEARAGLTLEVHLDSSTPNPNGSLDHNHLGQDSPLVGTNLMASSASNPGGSSPGPLNGFLDFTTGAYLGTNASGDSFYGGGGNFFLLGSLLSSSAGSSPLAYDASAGSTVVRSLGGGLFELTMMVTNAYLSAAIATPLGVAPGYSYDAALSFEFVVDPRKAGNQLMGGSIQFLGQPQPASGAGAVPEPASALMIAIGMIGLASARSFRARRSKVA